MADVTWPVDLPQNLLVAGYMRKPQSARVRTPMDSGPPKVRRINTAVIQAVTGSITVNTAQRNIFWTFYNDTIGYGSLAFNWTDPVTLSAVEMRFGEEEPSEIALDAGIFQIALPLEILP
jgi:hypothetical protein